MKSCGPCSRAVNKKAARDADTLPTLSRVILKVILDCIPLFSTALDNLFQCSSYLQAIDIYYLGYHAHAAGRCSATKEGVLVA